MLYLSTSLNVAAAIVKNTTYSFTTDSSNYALFILNKQAQSITYSTTANMVPVLRVSNGVVTERNENASTLILNPQEIVAIMFPPTVNSRTYSIKIS